MSNLSRTACSLAPAYFHHWRSNSRMSRSRSESSLDEAFGPEARAFAASGRDMVAAPVRARGGWCDLIIGDEPQRCSSQHRSGFGVSPACPRGGPRRVARANMTPMTTSTTLPEDLPPLDVTPGAVRAKPLPADRPVRWGILATGKIATAMVRNLALLDECAVVAVGARRQASADALGAEQRSGGAYGDYRARVEDPGVDVVYVASPHGLHRGHVEVAFEAGKAV